MRTRTILSSFHIELFYSLGWPGWAAANRLDPDEPGGEPRSADAHPYLARVSDSALQRTPELIARVSAEKELYVARVARDPWLVESESPTPERAAQFQGVYEQLVADATAWLARS